MTKSYRKIYSTGRALSREREKRQAVAKAKEGGEEEKVVTCDHTPAAHQWITMSHSCDYRVLYPSHSRQVHRGLPRLFPTSRRNCRSSRSPFCRFRLLVDWWFKPGLWTKITASNSTINATKHAVTYSYISRDYASRNRHGAAGTMRQPKCGFHRCFGKAARNLT